MICFEDSARSLLSCVSNSQFTANIEDSPQLRSKGANFLPGYLSYFEEGIMRGNHPRKRALRDLIASRSHLKSSHLPRPQSHRFWWWYWRVNSLLHVGLGKLRPKNSTGWGEP